MTTDSPLAGEPEPFNDPSPVDIEPETSAESQAFAEDDGVLYAEEVTPQHGILGFTLRELLIVGVWLIAFVTSFFPVYAYAGAASLWAQGIQWIMALGLPTAAVFLLVLRRFSPDGIRRVGSLGIDQFASVVFSIGAMYWATGNWELIVVGASTGDFPLSWLPIVQLVAALALVVLTVFAPLIPGLRDDFRGRLVTLAHRNANPARPVIAHPLAQERAEARAQERADRRDQKRADKERARIEKEQAAAAAAVPVSAVSDAQLTDDADSVDFADRVPMTSHASGGELGTQPGIADLGLGTVIGADDSDYVPAYARTSRGQFDADEEEIASAETTDFSQDTHLTDVIEDVDQTAPREPARYTDDSAESSTDAAFAGVSQPFWALAPTERDVLDEHGAPLFRIGPNAWALVIEDRGGAFVVRHDDGRIGYLHDIADITKG